MADGQEILLITEGNQKWKGAAPSLIIKPKSVKRWKTGVNILSKIKVDPRAWNRKYFKAASDSWCHLEEASRGIKEIILISKDIHTINQWDEDRAIMVLEIRVVKNRFI